VKKIHLSLLTSIFLLQGGCALAAEDWAAINEALQDYNRGLQQQQQSAYERERNRYPTESSQREDEDDLSGSVGPY